MKLLITGILVLLVLAGGLLAYVFLQPQEAVRNASNTNGFFSSEDPFGYSGTASTGVKKDTPVSDYDTVIAETQNEATKKVFTYLRENEDVFQSGAGPYYVIGTRTRATSSSYALLALEEDQSLQITIKSGPVGRVRKEAENALLRFLNLSEQEACDLTHYVLVDYGIDEKYEDADLGFSFCPGSVMLREI